MQQLPLTLADIQSLLARARAEFRSADVLQRLEWIIAFVEHGQSLEDTANLVGISPATLRRWIKRFDPADLSSLEERSHMPQRLRTSTVPAEVVSFIREYREREPLLGKERIAQLLQIERAVTISPSTVGRVIEREKLYFADTPLHLRKRMVRGATPVAPVATPIAPIATFAPVASAACTCVVCKVWNRDWSRVKRSVVMGSVLANVAVVALIAATAFFESKRALPESAEASLLHTSAAVIEETHMPMIDSASHQ